LNKIGIFSIREQFSRDLLKEINGRHQGVVRAEFAVVGETRLFEKSDYRAIVDRISAHVDYFTTYFKNAALHGTYVVNNPFGILNIDRFYNYSQARKAGFEVPRTVCLPTRDYHPSCGDEDLSNLQYPLDWESLMDFVGFPAFLKPYYGYGYREIYTVSTMSELIECYNSTGRQLMIVQEFIKYDFHVRTFVAGNKDIFTMKHNPLTREYTSDREIIGKLPTEKLLKEAMEVGKRLNIDFYAVDYAMKDGVPYIINLLNPFPECREETLTEEGYKWCLTKFADVVLDKADSEELNVCELALKTEKE